MGRFAERYAEPQREAVARAQLDQGMTAEQARQALKAGELDAPPVNMPLETARYMKRREQARRSGAHLHPSIKRGTEQALDRATEIAASTANRIADRIGKQPRPKAKDVTELAQAIRAIRQATGPAKPQQSGARTKTLTQQEQEHGSEAANGSKEGPSQRVSALLTEAKRTTSPNPNPHPAPPRTGLEGAQQAARPAGPVAHGVAHTPP